jgi:hypothetical protein
MKKGSTAAAAINKNFKRKLTIGLDLGDRSSWYCVLDEAGEVIRKQKLGTTPKAIKEVFAAIPTPVSQRLSKQPPTIALVTSLGREEDVAVRATIRDQCLFCVRHSQMLRINGHNIGVSTDGTSG